MTELVYEPSKIDFQRPGKAIYEVAFHNDSTWGFTLLPLAVINGELGPGRAVACFGGTHGDEYEGQVALSRLMSELDPAAMAGHVILVPRLNPPACAAGQRGSPRDGLDMNKVFPGDPWGSITRRIAHFVTSMVFPLVDVVIDIHSAGSAAGEFVMCTSFHAVESREQFEEMRRVASLFDTPFIMMYSSEMHSGLLTSQAEKLGKITIGSELGLQGVSVRGLRYAHEGIKNVLRHYDILGGEVSRIDPLRESPPKLVSAIDLESYVPAPITGVFEPLEDVGALVQEGRLVGRIYDLEKQICEPLPVYAPFTGYLIMQPCRAPIRRGDTMIVIAREVE